MVLRLLPQQGADLGDRMAALLDGLLAEGHPAAVVMGADSPTLPMAWVAEAVCALRDHTADLALGPADDGGYYLIGLRAPCPRLFRDVPWSTADVARVTLERAREAGFRVHLLPRCFDVGTAADLRRLEAPLRAPGGGPEWTRVAAGTGRMTTQGRVGAGGPRAPRARTPPPRSARRPRRASGRRSAAPPANPSV